MLAIRLARQGATHQPHYRVVVSDSRRRPSGSNREVLGYYDPKRNPPVIQIDQTRVDYWISKGAQPSSTVRTLLLRARQAPPAAAPATA